MTRESQIKMLSQLAIIDGDVAEEEKAFIRQISENHGFSEQKMQEIFDDPDLPKIEGLTLDDKFECLKSLIMLMKIDTQVYLSELNFCEKISEKLNIKGYPTMIKYSNGEPIGEIEARDYTSLMKGAMELCNEGCRCGEN